MNRTRYTELIIMIMSVLLSVATFSGCGKDNEVTDGAFVIEEDTNVRYAEKFQSEVLSEAGIISDEDGLLHLITIDEGEDMVLCYDPNCKHIPATRNRPDSECMAALFVERTQTLYYEGAIYFFVQDGIFDHKIYKMETDGAGRELIAKLPFGYNITQCALFSEDKVYYIAKIPYENELTSTIRFGVRIVEVNLLDGSYRFVCEETKDLIMQINLSGKTLYIRRAGAEDGGIYATRVNIDTLEETILVTAEVNGNEYAYVDAYDEDSFYYYGKQTYDIGIRNVDGTVEKVLIKGSVGEDFGWADPSCDGLFYNRTYDYEDEPVGSYFMDFLTGKVINITDEKVKYGIVGYDGYYDVFVAHDDEYNWTLWSKAKILDEATTAD
ncbi:MAG: hypothetical protein IJW18_06725 [Lachnospiraceae bacterium]|nr:hypothetical protein [Lachnospiraceae bacterium]